MRKLEKSDEASAKTPTKISSFTELVRKIANLSFEHKDYLLFFRGQSSDHKNKSGNSTFYPSIYRTNKEVLSKELLDLRFKKLEQASKLLIKKYETTTILDGSIKEIKTRKYIRWSILQHYEVCDTPLLDLTQSIRVACTFALADNQTTGFFYVFALPYVTNRISINSEHDIVNIRLINICPPMALRPYFQEAYSVGTDDITTEYDERTDLDFKRRLVDKFELVNEENKFWENEGMVERYLKHEDSFSELCCEIKNKISSENNLELVFPGIWENEYVFDSQIRGSELFEIKNENEYYVGEHHIFNLDSVIIDRERKRIEFRKVGANDNRKAFNALNIINDNLYEGLENGVTRITYRRKS